jgi:hypothetical protein
MIIFYIDKDIKINEINKDIEINEIENKETNLNSNKKELNTDINEESIETLSNINEETQKQSKLEQELIRVSSNLNKENNNDNDKEVKSEGISKYKEEEKENDFESEYDFSDIQINKVSGVGLYQRESELLFYNENHIQTVFRNNLYEEHGLEEDEIEEFIKSLYVIKTPSNMFKKSVVSDKLGRFLKKVLKDYSYEESIEEAKTELLKRLLKLENEISLEEFNHLKLYFNKHNTIEDILELVSIQIQSKVINKYLHSVFIKNCLSNIEHKIETELSNFRTNKEKINVEVLNNQTNTNVSIKSPIKDIKINIKKEEPISKINIEEKKVIEEVEVDYSKGNYIEIEKENLEIKKEFKEYFDKTNKLIEEKDLNIKIMINRIKELEEKNKDNNNDFKNEVKFQIQTLENDKKILSQKIESFETTLIDKNNEIKRINEEKIENRIQFDKNMEKNELLYKSIIEELKENQEFIKKQIKLNEENNIKNNEIRNNELNLLLSFRDKEIMNLKQQIEKMEDETYTKEEVRENYTHNDKLEEYYIPIKQNEEMLLKERESIQIKIENSNQNLRNELENNYKRKEEMIFEDFKNKELEIKKLITKNKKLTSFYKVNMDQELTNEELKDKELEDFILEMISEYGFNGEKLQKQLINRGYSFS